MNTLPSPVKAYLPDVISIALLMALSAFFYHKTICYWPSHIHAWTQGDRYALAIKFADTGLNLFQPRTFNLQTQDGITAVDMPVHDWAVGALMYVAGSRSPAIFRLYTLVFSILGCWFLFRLAKEVSGSVAKGWAVAVFVFTCPVIVYYQTGFIPSATSFSATLMGYFFYFRYQKKLKIKDFYWMTGLLTLAALSRSPFNIFLFAALLQQGLGWLRNRKMVRREALAFTLAYAAIAAAHVHKTWLAHAYGSQFLGKLLPAQSPEELAQILRAVFERWTFQLFSAGHYALLASMLFFLALRLIQGKTDTLTRKILLQSALSIAGGVIYFALMARQFVDHEYYFIDSLYPGTTLLLVASMACVPFNTRAQKIVLGVFMAFCLAWGAWESKKVQETKYSDKLSEAGETTRKNFIGAEALLDSLGIPGKARMLVIDAWSSNIPLILMNRMGHTLLSTSRPDLIRALNLDCDYVVVQDLYFPSDVVSNYPEILRLLERVGGNGRISIFRKSTAHKAATLVEALGIGHIWRTDSLDFEHPQAASLWKNTNRSAEQSVSPTHAGFINKNIEFGPTLELPIPANTSHRDFNKVLFEGWYFAQKTGDKFHTITTLENNGQLDFYNGYTFRVDSAGQWRQFHALFFLPDTAGEGQKLKCYIWNPGGTEMYLDDFKVTMYR